MARDSMTLDEVIQFTKQALEKVNPDKRVSTEFRFTVWQVKQLLMWLEDYKQLKDDYADLDNRLRTANTEIDRLQSVSSWHSCDEKPPERIIYLVTDGYCVYLGYYAVSEKHWTTEEDTDGNSLLYWMPIPKPPKE